MPPPRDAPRGSSRRLPVLLLVAAAALLIARIVTGVREHTESPALDDRVHWRAIAGAEAQSRAAGRPILYDFSAEWCGPCKLMAAEVFADERSAKTINARFVPVRVVDRQREDGRNPPDVQALLDRFEVEAFPTLVVYAPATGRHESVTGYAGRVATMEGLTQAMVKANLPVSERDSS